LTSLCHSVYDLTPDLTPGYAIAHKVTPARVGPPGVWYHLTFEREVTRERAYQFSCLRVY
jgi:hypothetical protein